MLWYLPQNILKLDYRPKFKSSVYKTHTQGQEIEGNL